MAVSAEMDVAKEKKWSAPADARSRKVEIRPIAGALGAEILGADLTQPIGDSMFADIHRSFLDHLVIFFPGQKPLTPDQQTAFTALFGEIDRAPFSYPFKTPTVDGHPQILFNVK